MTTTPADERKKIMAIYDAEICKGGSADDVIVRTVLAWQARAASQPVQEKVAWRWKFRVDGTHWNYSERPEWDVEVDAPSSPVIAEALYTASPAAISERIEAEYVAENDPHSQPAQRTALEQFHEFGADEEADPVERLRAFCSYAMQGQDWLDVEPFFDAISQPAQGPHLHPTDIYNFAGWLTMRPGMMKVGGAFDAAPMADAVGEYLDKFPERFATPPADAARQDRIMELADDYAREVADAPNMPTPLERKLSTVKIEKARAALEREVRKP